MKSKIINSNPIDLTCLNCGTTASYKVTRFPVCNCGHSIMINNNDTYGVYDSQLQNVIIARGEKTDTVKKDDIHILIDVLPGLMFWHESEVKKELLNSMDKDFTSLSVFQSYTVSQLLLHNIYYEYSDVYRAVFDHGYYKLAARLAQDKMLRQFEDDMPNTHLIDVNFYIFDEFNDSRMCLGLDYYLYGFDPKWAKILSAYNITYLMYQTIREKTNYDNETVVNYVKNLGETMLSGLEIVESIIEYKKKTTELAKVNIRFDSGDPFFHNVNLANTLYRMNTRNGLLSLYNYKESFSFDVDQSQSAYIDGYMVRYLNYNDIYKLPSNTLPMEKLECPVLAAFKDNTIVSMVINGENSTAILGRQDDEIKKVFNKYFDMQDL